MDQEFRPNNYDKIVLLLLVVIGTYTLYGWFFDAFMFARERVKRAYRTIEYAYVTPDHKVIKPESFGASIE